MISQTRGRHGVQEKGFIQMKGLLGCWTMTSRSKDLCNFMAYDIGWCVVILRERFTYIDLSLDVQPITLPFWSRVCISVIQLFRQITRKEMLVL